MPRTTSRPARLLLAVHGQIRVEPEQAGYDRQHTTRPASCGEDQTTMRFMRQGTLGEGKWLIAHANIGERPSHRYRLTLASVGCPWPPRLPNTYR